MRAGRARAARDGARRRARRIAERRPRRDRARAKRGGGGRGARADACAIAADGDVTRAPSHVGSRRVIRAQTTTRR